MITNIILGIVNFTSLLPSNFPNFLYNSSSSLSKHIPIHTFSQADCHHHCVLTHSCCYRNFSRIVNAAFASTTHFTFSPILFSNFTSTLFGMRFKHMTFPLIPTKNGISANKFPWKRFWLPEFWLSVLQLVHVYGVSWGRLFFTHEVSHSRRLQTLDSIHMDSTSCLFLGSLDNVWHIGLKPQKAQAFATDPFSELDFFLALWNSYLLFLLQSIKSWGWEDLQWCISKMSVLFGETLTENTRSSDLPSQAPFPRELLFQDRLPLWFSGTTAAASNCPFLDFSPVPLHISSSSD